MLIRGNALRGNSAVVTNAYINHMEIVAGSGNREIARTNPSIPIRVANLSRIPINNSVFSTISSRHLTEALISREGTTGGRRVFGTRAGIALSGLFSRVGLNRVGRLRVVIGTSMRNSTRTIGRSLRGLSGSRMEMGMVRDTMNTVGRSSMVLTRTSGTVVMKFGIHPSTITTRGTRHSNMSVHLCDVVCSYVGRVRSTVGNVLTPGAERIILNVTRYHGIVGVGSINAVTNSCIGDNGVRHNTDMEIVHSNVIVTSSTVTSLREFGSTIGRIDRNCRYNVNLREFGSLGRNSVFRICAVRRCESWDLCIGPGFVGNAGSP